MSCVRGLCILGLVFIGFGTRALAATLVVDPTGSGDYTTIQPAIDAAQPGDVVLVKAGEYVIAEPINFNRLHRADNPGSPPVKNITLKAESGAETTVIRMSDSPTHANRASVATFENGESNASILHGFSLIGGKGINEIGGGVFCYDNSSPTLIDCTISGNFASSGGGLYCGTSASPVLENCTISQNVAHSGGGAYCYNSSPTLTNCIIYGNNAGRGATTDYASQGGGIYSSEASPTLRNCLIFGNSAHSFGLVIIEGEVVDVAPHGSGGGIHAEEANLINCTISGNWANSQSSGLCCPTDVINCLLWGNAFESIFGDRSPTDSEIDPKFINNGVFDFSRYINGFPDFIIQFPDFHLQRMSPAIDAGTLVGAPSTDIDGNQRPSCNGIDIGAYEYIDCSKLMRFHRGDTNENGIADISDAIAVLSNLFIGNPATLSCRESADVDNDGRIDISDGIVILLYLFGGGRQPAAPGPVSEPCGVDTDAEGSPGDLGCESYAHCE